MAIERRILIVDDTPANLAAFESLLAPLGYRIDLARSAREGLDLARPGHHAVILIDVRMPIRGGLEMADRLRREEPTRGRPIVFLPALAARADRSGRVDFLFNLDSDVLRAKVARLGGASPGGGALEG